MNNEIGTKDNGKIHFDSLDSLKGIGACLIAFIYHYQHFSPANGLPFYRLFSPFYQYGIYVVEMFFMISGFAMAYAYSEKIIGGTVHFGEYMAKRIKHLYPLFFITLLFITFAELMYKSVAGGDTFVYANFDIYHFMLNLLCIQDGWLGVDWSFNAPSWCIPVQILCYLIFFIIVYFFKNHKSSLKSIYALISILGIALLLSGIELPLFNYLTARGISCFFIGALLYEIYSIRKHFKNAVISYILLFALLFTIVITKMYGFEIWGNIQLVIILLIAPACIWVSINIGWVRKILEVKPLVLLGKSSMSIYLWHFPVQCMIAVVNLRFDLKIDFSSRLFYIIYILITLTVALCSYLYLEKYVSKFFTLFKNH